MDQPLDSQLTDDAELTLETLDQWEAELDEFAANIKQRLAMVTLTAEASPVSSGNEIPIGRTLEPVDSIRKSN